MTAIQVEVVEAPRVILVEIDQRTTVTVDDGPDIALELTLPGIQGASGPPGPQGPAGPQGPTGPAGAAREIPYDFAIPASFWEVTHDLPVTPSVYAYDISGAQVEGNLTYHTPTSVRIEWAFPMAGHLLLTT